MGNGALECEWTNSLGVDMHVGHGMESRGQTHRFLGELRRAVTVCSGRCGTQSAGGPGRGKREERAAWTRVLTVDCQGVLSAVFSYLILGRRLQSNAWGIPGPLAEPLGHVGQLFRAPVHSSGAAWTLWIWGQAGPPWWCMQASSITALGVQGTTWYQGKERELGAGSVTRTLSPLSPPGVCVWGEQHTQPGGLLRGDWERESRESFRVGRNSCAVWLGGGIVDGRVGKR